MEVLRQKVVSLTFLSIVGIWLIFLINQTAGLAENKSFVRSVELVSGYEPQSGDFVFREGRGFWSPFFKRANSRFGYTHVGIIVREADQLYVLHAEADDLTLGGGVQKTLLEKFLVESEAFTIKKNLMNIAVRGRFVEELYAMFEASLAFDSEFDLEDEGRRVYCTELIWLSAKRSGIESLGETTFLRGRPVILVDSIYSSSLLSETFGKRRVSRSR